MSVYEETQTETAVTQQQHPPRQQPSVTITHDRRILLIRAVRNRPRLYKNEFLRTPFLHRHEKQKIWDEIAREANIYKTEDAKIKWRSLVSYLRQHLEHVAQKKVRRYIPNTQNSDDRYVQLNDWTYYKELEFIVPYVKYAATKQQAGVNCMNPTANEIDLIIKSIEEDLNSNVDDNIVETNSNSNSSCGQPTTTSIDLGNGEDNLTTEEEILKEFFENMLKTTLSMPRFHQNRIKNKLAHIVNEQKEK